MGFLGKNRLFHNPSIIQKLDGVLVFAMLPHQGEEPDPAFADPEIGRGEGHGRVDGFLIAFGGVFRLQPKSSPCQSLPSE